MTNQYAKNVIIDLFEEGDRDDVFLWQLIGLSEFDGEDESRGKTRDEILDGAVMLAFFLKSNGIFSLFEVADVNVGELGLREFSAGHEDFSLALREADRVNSADVGFKFLLRKKKEGKAENFFPDEILKLLS